MDTRFSLILHKISSFCLYAVIFLIPLFFLPFTLDILELNKYFLFYFLVLLSLVCYFGRAIIRKVFEFRSTPLDIPLLALWVVFLLVSLLSEERYLSFFGDFGLINLSFIGFSLMLIFYFLITQLIVSMEQTIKMLYVFLLSGGLASLYFILRTFNLLKIPALNFVLPSNLAHSSSAIFGIFLAVVSLVALAVLALKKKKHAADIFIFVALLLSLVAMTAIGFKLIWIILAVSVFLLLVFFLTYVDYVNTLWTSFGFAILVVSLLFIFLGTPQFLTVRLPVEVSLAPQVSWEIVFKALTADAKTFIFGSGPSTFVYDFSAFRPAVFNNNFAWNIRFHQPYSSAFDWVATTGLLGTLTLLFTVLMALGLVITIWYKQILELRHKKKLAEPAEQVALQESPLLFWGLVAGWLTLLLAFFLTNFSLVLWVLFWAFLGLMNTAGLVFSKRAVEVRSFSLKASPQYALATSFGFILIFTLIIVLGVYEGRYFIGEVVYTRALRKPLDQRIVDLQKAVNLNANRGAFYLTLAEAFLNKAAEVNRKTNDLNQVTPLVASAVNSARAATDKSPNNVATWEYLSTMYANARPIAPEANSWVISSLEKAVTLESTNPVFYVGLGDAKFLQKRYTESKEDYQKAIDLKPDLTVAYMRMAMVQEAQNDISGAIATMEKGLNYGRQDTSYVFQLGRYYFNRGQKNDLPLAELAFRRAIALNPNYSDALFSLGFLYEKQNFDSQALQLYRRVLELNPGNKDIKKKIDALIGVLAPAPAPEAPKKK